MTATPPPSEPELWTVERACEYFGESGLPIRPERLRLIIRGLDWLPAGRGPTGPEGGTGEALYPMADLMILHARLTEFLVTRGIPRRPPKQAAAG